MNAIKSVSFEFGDYPWLNPIQIGATTLKNKGAQISTVKNIIDILQQIEHDDYTDFMKRFYQTGIERFGEHWGYNDQLTILHAAATFLKPENYLEIGVFRGRSMSVIAHTVPTCNMYGFDMWIDNYSGLENPGATFVESQLRRVGHQGQVLFTSGNSKETVPALFERYPDLFFDLITVDGDHSEEGAKIDIENVLPRLKVGGILVFDDISHPQFPWLERVWDDLIGNNPNFVSGKYTEVGHGVAFAIRRTQTTILAQFNKNIAEHITQVITQLRNLESERSILQTMLSAKEEYEFSLHEAIMVKDEYITVLEKALQSQEKSLQETVKFKDNYITSLQNMVETKDTYGQSLQEIVNTSEEYIRSLRNTVDTREEYINSLRNTLAVREEHIISISEVLHARDNELINAKEYIDSLENHLQRLQDYVNDSGNKNHSQGE